MKPVLIDASSAILLHKADLLAVLWPVYPLFMVPAVKKEVSVAGRPGASWFAQALAEGRISLLSIEHDDNEGHASLAVGAGERQMVGAFCSGRAKFIIMDDRRGCRLCRRLGIPYINALLCPRLLCWAGCLDERQGRLGFERLLNLGRYSRGIVDFADRSDPARLAFFMPEKSR